MSYEIYKSVKQNADGTFDCVCSPNNISPLYWSNYHMTYFNDEFPSANKDELRAIWELYSTGSGDHFYSSSWKKNQKLAGKFMKEHNYDWWDFHKNKDLWLSYAREFIAYKKNESKKSKKTFVVTMEFGSYRQYIWKKGVKRVWATDLKSCAKKFKAESEEEVMKEFAGYDLYKPIVEEF